MKKNVIISLADAKYFDLLNELVDSIQSFKESQNSAICILDAGLTEQQRQNLSNKVDEIKSADWDIKVPEFKIRGKEWLKSQVSRAFLPNYFPEFDKYVDTAALIKISQNDNIFIGWFFKYTDELNMYSNKIYEISLTDC